ncbi:MAG: hypothetical protein V7741_00550, partial [Hyphomonas sp.]
LSLHDPNQIASGVTGAVQGHVFGYDLGASERAPCKWNNYPDRGEFGRARARNNLCPFVQTHPKKRTVSNGCA